MFENELRTSIKRRDLRGLLLSGSNKNLFLAYLSFKVTYVVEIWYVNLVHIREMPFRGFDFSLTFHRITAQKTGVFEQIFYFSGLSCLYLPSKLSHAA